MKTPVRIGVPNEQGTFFSIEYTDERRVEYVRFRLNPLTWSTKYRQDLYPAQMTSGHLLNTIAMIRDGRMAKQGRHTHKGRKIVWWARVFENELLHREHERLLSS